VLSAGSERKSKRGRKESKREERVKREMKRERENKKRTKRDREREIEKERRRRRESKSGDIISFAKSAYIKEDNSLSLSFL
jgi:hypothetical protein